MNIFAMDNIRMNMSNSNERIKVQGPNGQTTYMSRKAAESEDIRQIGFRPAEDLYADVPSLGEDGAEEVAKRKPGRPAKIANNAN